MISCKIISSLEKVFHNTDIGALEQLERISALKGERLSFQMAFVSDKAVNGQVRVPLKLEGALAEYATVRNISSVSVLHPVNPTAYDDEYLSTEPGLYPDLLEPFRYRSDFIAPDRTLRSLWFELDPRGEVEAGSTGSELCVRGQVP